MHNTDNKQVVKNTLFLYFRMILIMLVTLYTSRVILAELGIKDYGIYNVVGGVVMMFSFLNNCMSSATQRFLTIELGKRNIQNLKHIFAAALNIHIIIAFCVIILAETIGLWFVNVRLVIPDERVVAANWVYQFSILTFCINIIQVPYNAVLIAHEKMNIYAYISIFESFLKLGIAYLLVIVSSDKLIVYGILVFLVQLIIRIIYQYYCRCYYQESQFQLYWNKSLYKEMACFAGWNLFGSIAWLLRDQGVNIILNLFFGPMVNAARGIAMQVSSAVFGFVSNFQTALNPQITKNYALGDISQMEKLTYSGLKYSCLLLFVITFPLCLNIDFVLSVWLVDVPDYSSIFVVLIVIDALMGTLFGVPLMTSLSATGKIRIYQIVVSSIILCILPVSYVFLKCGGDVISVFYISIIFTVLSGLVRFLFCRKQLGYSIRRMFQTVLIPVVVIFILSFPIPFFLKIYFFSEPEIGNSIILSLVCVALTIILSWYVGLNFVERNMIILFIKKKLMKSNERNL